MLVCSPSPSFVCAACVLWFRICFSATKSINFHLISLSLSLSMSFYRSHPFSMAVYVCVFCGQEWERDCGFDFLHAVRHWMKVEVCNGPTKPSVLKCTSTESILKSLRWLWSIGMFGCQFSQLKQSITIAQLIHYSCYWVAFLQLSAFSRDIWMTQKTTERFNDDRRHIIAEKIDENRKEHCTCQSLSHFGWWVSVWPCRRITSFA